MVYIKYVTFCSHRTKKFKCFQVELYIQTSHFFIYGDLEARAKCKAYVEYHWVLGFDFHHKGHIV